MMLALYHDDINASMMAQRDTDHEFELQDFVFKDEIVRLSQGHLINVLSSIRYTNCLSNTP